VNVLVQTSKFKEGVLPINAVNDSELILKIYLFSDVHFDSVMCNRKALEKHLNKAKEEDALIVLGGDWFDAMQGRFDPRSSLDELRPNIAGRIILILWFKIVLSFYLLTLRISSW